MVTLSTGSTYTSVANWMRCIKGFLFIISEPLSTVSERLQSSDEATDY